MANSADRTSLKALISNKNDLSLERQVENKEGESFAKQINVNFVSFFELIQV